MSMRIGRLRHRIVIQQPPDVNQAPQDEYGAETPAWTTFATVWASVEPLQGRERLASQEVQAEVSHRMRLRHLEGLSSRMRVSFDGRIFGITDVINPEERDEEMQLMCVERMVD